jgi:hypothetical protein
VRGTIGLFLGPILALGVLAAPTGLESQAHRLAAVFTLVIVLYLIMLVALVLAPWEWPNFKAMIGKGKGGGGYVPLDYAREENPDWIKHLEAEGKVK